MIPTNESVVGLSQTTTVSAAMSTSLPRRPTTTVTATLTRLITRNTPRPLGRGVFASGPGSPVETETTANVPGASSSWFMCRGECQVHRGSPQRWLERRLESPGQLLQWTLTQACPGYILVFRLAKNG